MEFDVDLIFIDTEFTSFDTMEMISLVMVDYRTREEYYVEVVDLNDDNSSDFVRENIYPLLRWNRYGRFKDDVRVEAGRWLGKFRDPVIVCDWYGDFKVLKKSVDLPKDVRTFLYPADIVFNNFQFLSKDDYGMVQEMFAKFVDEIFIGEKLDRHHALNDARVNLKSFEMLIDFFNKAVDE